MAVWTAALFLITEPVVGNFIEPMLYGQSTGLSPVSVIVAAIFWSWIWGPVGLVLSTPLTLCLVVLGRHVERLEFLDVILGDRPALTPVENFYQRLLAGDADELQEHADLLLKERSLSSYYDEVALKGLQLAANDVTRGVLAGPRLERIRQTVHDLVEELDVYPDVDPVEDEESPAGSTGAERRLPKQPAPDQVLPDAPHLAPEWRGPHPVLCVAGRGPLDEAASEILSQLLRKHGIGAQVVSYESVSRRAIVQLAAEGVAMVCISYLEISGTPSHVRYLLRRMRQRLPNARMLVGVWPAAEAILSDAALRSLVGADDYVTSLREAVQACLRAAQPAADSEPAADPATEVAPAGQETAPVLAS
jgi:hypothetical protein